MPNVFLIGSVEHTKGERCKACFNGFPYDCISDRCDGYLHGHQVQVKAAVEVQSSCDLCGDKWNDKPA